MNLLAYLKAGYVPILFCRRDVALEVVARKLESEVRFNEEAIEVDIGDDFWVPSKYYYEGDCLFKKEA